MPTDFTVYKRPSDLCFPIMYTKLSDAEKAWEKF